MKNISLMLIRYSSTWCEMPMFVILQLTWVDLNAYYWIEYVYYSNISSCPQPVQYLYKIKQHLFDVLFSHCPTMFSTQLKESKSVSKSISKALLNSFALRTTLWSHYRNKNVFSLKRLHDKSGCLRSVNRLFQTRDPYVQKAAWVRRGYYSCDSLSVAVLCVKSSIVGRSSQSRLDSGSINNAT